MKFGPPRFFICVCAFEGRAEEPRKRARLGIVGKIRSRGFLPLAVHGRGNGEQLGLTDYKSAFSAAVSFFYVFYSKGHNKRRARQ